MTTRDWADDAALIVAIYVRTRQHSDALFLVADMFRSAEQRGVLNGIRQCEATVDKVFAAGRKGAT